MIPDHAISNSRARSGGLAGRLGAALRRLSDRAHAGGDDRARAMGWAVTPVPGPLGLNGRAYRDPRFSTRGRR